jgi:MFS family permease
MSEQTVSKPRPGRWYLLALLTVALSLSLLDRQVLTILAGPIKADLGLSDAEMGLLIGTTFAVFYSLFGIPLGRLADSWKRTRMITIGLLGWSIMTMFSGLATSLVQLAFARTIVGVGEASANPAAYSLISDSFPRRQRATAIAIYSTGVAFGLGASLWVGGAVVDLWNAWYPHGGAPFGLKGWQVAFLAVGAPGLLIAVLTLRLREPERAGTAPNADRPFLGFWAELFAILPPFTLINLVRLRASGRDWAIHLAVLAAIAIGAAALIDFANAITPPAKHKVLFEVAGLAITGHAIHWSSLGVGVYGIFAWAQSLRLRDAPAFALIFRSPAMLALLGAAALEMFTNYGLTSWAPFYAVTKYKLPLATVGLQMGFIAGLAGVFGTNIGGVLADRFGRFGVRGRLCISLAAMTLPVPLVPIMLSAPTLTGMLAWWMLVGTLVTAWLAGAASASQELVLPRMRGTAAAALTLSMTMIGLGLGPYTAGLVSDVTGSLFDGIVSVYAAVPLLIVLMLVAIWTAPRVEREMAERARAAGEPGA